MYKITFTPDDYFPSWIKETIYFFPDYYPFLEGFGSVIDKLDLFFECNDSYYYIYLKGEKIPIKSIGHFLDLFTTEEVKEIPDSVYTKVKTGEVYYYYVNGFDILKEI